MYTQGKIFSLALNALLLQRQVINPLTDNSNECKVLLNVWDTALQMTLEDLDLDRTSTFISLQLIQTRPIPGWQYAYLYPDDCVFLRRIRPCGEFVRYQDCRATHIPKQVAQFNGKNVIFTNQDQAIAQYISSAVSLNSLSASAGLAVALRLATLAAPLVTGKGAAKLMDGLEKKYVYTKAEAQAVDERENFNFTPDDVQSEFVAARHGGY